MTRHVWFVCDCGSQYNLGEATQSGMLCPAHAGRMRRMDSAWAVGGMETPASAKCVPRGTHRNKGPSEALITLLERN